MHCYTIRDEAVRGIQARTTADGLVLPVGDGGVPLETQWSNYITVLVGDVLERAEGRRMRNPYILYGGFSREGDMFKASGELFPKDRALVRLEVDAGTGGSVKYTSAMFVEEDVEGRIERRYLSLREAVGVESLTPEAPTSSYSQGSNDIVEPLSMVLVLKPGASVRVQRSGAGLAWRTRVFTWWGDEMSWTGRKRPSRQEAQVA